MGLEVGIFSGSLLEEILFINGTWKGSMDDEVSTSDLMVFSFSLYFRIKVLKNHLCLSGFTSIAASKKRNRSVYVSLLLCLLSLLALVILVNVVYDNSETSD